MPEKRPRRYRRLRGATWRGILGVTRSAVRIADDHLLLCDGQTGLTEQYRRFYFADLQAFIIGKTPLWIISAMVWVFLTIMFAALASAFSWNWIASSITIGICVLFLAINFVRGATCRTYIQTAVQTDRLPMLRRVRQTRRVLAILKPLIVQAQSGLVDIPPVAVGPATVPTSPVDAAITEPAAEPFSASEPARLSLLHLTTVVVVAVSAGLAFLDLWLHSTVAYTIWLLSFAAAVILIITALARRSRHPVHRGATIAIWILAIGDVLGAVASNSIFAFLHIISSMQTEVARSRPGRPPGFTVAPFTPYVMRHMSGFDYVLWTYAIASLLLAIIGLIFIFAQAPAKAGPPPLPIAS